MPATPGWCRAARRQSAALPLDFNGDGFDDLVWASGGTWRFMAGGAAGYGSATNTGITATNPTKAMPLDWNSDGRADLLVDWSDSKWRVLKGNATGFDSPVHAGPGSGIPSNPSASKWWIADIDGDGRDDLLRVRTTTNAALRIWVRAGSATGFAATETLALDDPYLWPMSQPLGSLSERYATTVHQPDFNGDGREDLLVRVCEDPMPSCIFVGWVQVFGKAGGLLEAAFTAVDATGTERPMPGDFNGDQLTDFAYRCQSAGQWCAAISRGEGGYTLSYGPSTSGYLSYLYLVGDYDGDGFDDLYAARSSGTWDVIRGSGAGLTTSARRPAWRPPAAAGR